jgi:hypothetical protein
MLRQQEEYFKGIKRSKMKSVLDIGKKRILKKKDEKYR